MPYHDSWFALSFWIVCVRGRESSFLAVYCTEDEVCIHGRWEDGACICDRGFQTDDEATDSHLVLNPVYCSKQVITYINHPGYLGDQSGMLHLMAMAVSCTVCVEKKKTKPTNSGLK